MYYTIDKDKLRALVEEEISKVADEAYSDNGLSLYDSIVLTEKDKPAVERFIDDAVSLLVRRAFDICKYAPELISDGQGNEYLSPNMRLRFFVPDFESSRQDALFSEIDRYISMYTVSSILQQRRAGLVPEYTARTQTALDNAIILLKTRKHPSLW